MNARDVRLVFLRESRELLRDRRALFAGVVLPVLLYPILFFGAERLEKRARAAVARREVVVAFLPGTSAILQALAPRLAGPQCRLEEGAFGDADLASERVHAIVRSDPPQEGETAPRAVVRYRATSDLSADARRRVLDAIDAWREERRVARLAEWGIVPDPAAALRFESVDAAGPERAGGAAVGRLLPLLLVMVVLSGGSFAALDAFAGERERGTLETLLVHPVSPTDIAAGKYLAVLAASLVAATANLGSIGATLLLGGGGRLGEVSLAPRSVAAVVAFLLPTAAFLSALLCVLASRARSFREGQSFLLPLTFVCMIPGLAAMMPGVELTPVLALVPLAGAALAIREVLRGPLDLVPVLLAFVSTCVYAASLVRSVGRTLDAERILRDAPPPSEAARARLISRRTLGAAAIAFLLVFYLGFPAQARNPLSGLVVTLFGIVLPASFVVARAARLSTFEAFPLSRPLARHLLAGIALVPLGAILSTRAFELQNRFLPAPESLLRELAERLQLETIPASLALFLFALAPGLCEEMLFRGSILAGVKKDLSTRAAVVISALLFGAFHFSIYRFAPQALLGVVLGVTRVRSGSLWPPILLHTGHNALVLLAGDGIGLLGSDPAFLAASAAAAAAAYSLLAPRTGGHCAPTPPP